MKTAKKVEIHQYGALTIQKVNNLKYEAFRANGSIVARGKTLDQVIKKLKK